LQQEKPLAEIEDQETSHRQGKNFAAGPATLARSLDGFGQQVEERCPKENTGTETEQQVDVFAGPKSESSAE
jgi:hypothetical protein